MSNSANGAANAQGLLRARFRPPRFHQTLIRRSRLNDALSTDRSPVILAVAPPGFGKSALIASWIEGESAKGVKSIWFSFVQGDTADNVLDYLVAAVCETAPSAIRDEQLASDRDSGLHLRLQRLLAAIENFGESWIFVLDNVNEASNAVVTHIVASLLRMLPDNLRIVLTSTNRDIAGLSEASGRGLVAQLDNQDLRFDADEVRAVWGRAISQAKAHQVERMTGGWPILVHLLREESKLPEKRRSRNAKFLPHPIAEFISQRILPSLSDQQIRLLTKLSLLPRLSPKVVGALGETSAGVEELERLKQLELVLAAPAEEKMNWAVHPIIKQYFQEKLEAEAPLDAQRFRYEAARVFLNEGKTLGAVRLAVDTGDADFIGDIIEGSDPLLLWLRDGAAKLHKILRLAPKAVARRRPSVGYATIISFVKVGKLREAQRLFDELEEARMRMEEPGGTGSRRLACERELCRSMLGIYKGTPISFRELSELRMLGEGNDELAQMLRIAFRTLDSYLKQQRGEFDDAMRIARSAVTESIDARSNYNAFFTYCDLAMMSGYQGDWRAANDFFREGERNCQQSVRDDERLALIRDVFKLELQHERWPHESQNNERLRNICRKLPKLEGWPDVYAAAYRTYSEKLLLSGDASGALSLNASGLLRAEAQAMRPVVNVLLAQRIFLSACAGQPEDLGQQFNALERSIAGWRAVATLSWREIEAVEEARLAAAIAFGFEGPMGSALAEASAFGVQKNLRAELRLRRLLASVEEQGAETLPTFAGNRERAVQLLKATRFRRASAFARMLIARRRSGGPQSSPVRVDCFTEREVAVLRRLGKGMTDKAIAQELGISAHGVRYHLKRIYAQLGVGSRREACERAQEFSFVS